MPNIDAVRFDSAGWKLMSDKPQERIWVTEDSDTVMLNVIDLPPDIPVPLSNLPGVRGHSRETAAAWGGGLVSADVVEIHNLPAVQAILKVQNPERERGAIYLGSLTFPFERCSYVIRAQAIEYGTTGVRDAVVFGKHVQGRARDAPFPPTDWALDPYDPTYRAAYSRNRSDDEEWDASFPDHPLSRLRRCLARITKTIETREEIGALEAFRGLVR